MNLLTVMSFNIRCSTAPDGPNAWSFRKPLVLQMIQKHDADLIGLQEGTLEQVEFLQANLTEYDSFSIGRSDGKLAGEHSTIFFRKQRFSMVASGVKWLSKNPEAPGSIAPGANLPRIVSWARLAEKGHPEFAFLNTHFDHESAPARELGAKLILDVANDLGPVILTGDFNATPDESPITMLSNTLTRAVASTGNAGTFNGFGSEPEPLPEIDHIFFSREFQLADLQVDQTRIDGRLPSDHFPLVAKLSW